MTSQFQLIMRSGPTPGAAFMLEGDQLTIGRDATNDIVINDAEISRRHARLTFQGGKYVLEDLVANGSSIIEKATMVKNGKLTDHYEYLKDYSAGK